MYLTNDPAITQDDLHHDAVVECLSQRLPAKHMGVYIVRCRKQIARAALPFQRFVRRRIQSAPVPRPDLYFEKSELCSAVKNFVKRLPSEPRKIAHLLSQGLSRNEVACLVGCSPATICRTVQVIRTCFHPLTKYL